MSVCILVIVNQYCGGMMIAANITTPPSISIVDVVVIKQCSFIRDRRLSVFVFLSPTVSAWFVVFLITIIFINSLFHPTNQYWSPRCQLSRSPQLDFDHTFANQTWRIVDQWRSFYCHRCSIHVNEKELVVGHHVLSILVEFKRCCRVLSRRLVAVRKQVNVIFVLEYELIAHLTNQYYLG